MGSHGMRERTEHRDAIETAITNAADALDLDLTPEQIRPLAALVDAELRHDGWRLDVLRPAVDQVEPAVGEPGDPFTDDERAPRSWRCRCRPTPSATPPDPDDA